jgi:hypothetical protein
VKRVEAGGARWPSRQHAGGGRCEVAVNASH